jgi:hypothetical protein
MSYEAQMQRFAKGAAAAHGQLVEVVFLKGDSQDSLLVFADGAAVPVLHQKHGYKISREHYAFSIAAELGGQDPFEFLRFGYSGTGPTHYSYFLTAAGFRETDVSNINEPLRLKRDGTKIRGIAKPEQVEWQDGTVTGFQLPSTSKKWWHFWK